MEGPKLDLIGARDEEVDNPFHEFDARPLFYKDSIRV
jgi:hypothetical protein